MMLRAANEARLGSSCRRQRIIPVCDLWPSPRHGLTVEPGVYFIPALLNNYQSKDQRFNWALIGHLNAMEAFASRTMSGYWLGA